MWLVGTQAEVGQLFTSCRAKSGGPLIDLDKGIWGVDDFWPRLSLCAISIDAPYDIVAEPTHWLFIEAQSMYWMIDNLRIDLGLRPKYQRRVAPQDALRPDVFPGIAESKEMTEYWFRLRAGITEPPLIRIDNFKPAAVNSGAPGRPTSMGLVLELFEKRIAEGVLAQDKLAEATVLSLALDEINKQRVGKGLEPHPSLKPRSIRPKIAARYDEVQRGV